MSTSLIQNTGHCFAHLLAVADSSVLVSDLGKVIPIGFHADPGYLFLGTFAPSLRASESPMAIACLLLFTFLPLRPIVSVPFSFSFIAFSTFLEAAFEYLVIKKFYKLNEMITPCTV
jgi:hypothetical protein